MASLEPAEVGPPHTIVVDDDAAGLRLDQLVARAEPGHSRSAVQAWIKAGLVTIDGRARPGSTRVRSGDVVAYRTAAARRAEKWTAEPVAVDVVFEDEHLIIVDKPAGLTVHPGAGNPDGTLVNGILARFPETEHVPRAGLVHRIDKDTSGLLAVARSAPAHQALTRAIARHEVEREYLAVVNRVMIAGTTIDAPIARHPVDRLRMTVTAADDPRGRRARTHVRVVARYRCHTAVRARLETGRTHQIRVHLAHIGHPLVGDSTYGGRLLLPPSPLPALKAVLEGFRRQALHAARLRLRHPVSGAPLEFTAPTPDDLHALLTALADDLADHRAGAADG